MKATKDQPNVRRKEDDRRYIFVTGALLVLVLVVLLYARIPETAPEKKGGPVVAATMFPLYDIARNVAAPEIDVLLILPRGANPHTFEPAPATLTALQDADVLYAIGHGIDGWAERIAGDMDTETIFVDRGIPLRASADEKEEGGADDGHGSDGRDPHYWLNVLNAMTIARNVSDDLQSRFPESADATERRTQEYLSRLRELHTRMVERIGAVENKRIVTLHDAWYYFADAYGLDIVGTFQPSAGREPTPRYLADLQAAIAEAGTTRLFSEPQIATASLDAFVRDNGLTIEILDPEGTSPGLASYIDLMEYNADVIAGE